MKNPKLTLYKKLIDTIVIRKVMTGIFFILVAFILNGSSCDRTTQKKCSSSFNTGTAHAVHRTGPLIYGVDSVFIELTELSFNISSFEGNQNIKIQTVIPRSDPPPPYNCETIPLHFCKAGTDLPADPFGSHAYNGLVRIFWNREGSDIEYSSYGAAHIRLSYYIPEHDQFREEQLNNLDCYQNGDPSHISCLTAHIKMYNPFPDAKPDIVITGKCLNFALPNLQEFTYNFEDVKICANYSDPYFRYPQIFPIQGRYKEYNSINVFYFNALIDKGTFPINEVSLYYRHPNQNFQKKTINDWQLLLNKGIINTSIESEEDIVRYYWEIDYGGDATDIIQTDDLRIEVNSNVRTHNKYFEYLGKCIYNDKNWLFYDNYMCSSYEVSQP